MKTKERKHNKKNNIKTIKLITLLIFFIAFLFFIPDLILSFRNFLYDILKINTNLKPSSSSYIQMMISILSCCVTTVVGLSTFFLTKILRNIDSENHKAKISTSAFRLYKNIKHNCYVIYNASRNVGDLKSELRYNSSLDEIWFNLYAAGKLNNNDVKLLDNYNRQIQEIAQYLEKNLETEDSEKEFCNNFFKGKNDYDYCDDMKNLLDKLEKCYEMEDVIND